jgi:dienelactone hydrolase
MAEIVLFHHAQGCTPGVLHFAESLRAEGHLVHVPDLYDGATFDDLDDGVAHARSIGFDTLVDRGVAAAQEWPAEVVYAGFSMGVMPAMALAQNRPGARAVVFLHGAVPLGELGAAWPAGLPLQLHTRRDDDWGDAEEAEKLAAEIPGTELFLYPGDEHLFTDDSLAAHDPEATALVRQRMAALLDRLA